MTQYKAICLQWRFGQVPKVSLKVGEICKTIGIGHQQKKIKPVLNLQKSRPFAMLVKSYNSVNLPTLFPVVVPFKLMASAAMHFDGNYTVLEKNRQISTPMEYCHIWPIILVKDGPSKFWSYIILIIHTKIFIWSLLFTSLLSIIRKLNFSLKGVRFKQHLQPILFASCMN